MRKSIVLSDELLKEYYAFKHNEESDISIIEELFSSYKPHITNVAQLQRIGITKPSIINPLLGSGLTKQTLLGLADKTKYKVILDKKRTDYPYLNIFKDEIENNYSATYQKNFSQKNLRKKAQEHIKALLKNANYVFIYDKYILQRWDYSKKFFTELLPKKTLTICYANEYRADHLSDKATEIKRIHTHWKIIEDASNINHRNLYDRYIIIDSKIEIILTSGFDNLFDESSDFTYIIRDIEQE